MIPIRIISIQVLALMIVTLVFAEEGDAEIIRHLDFYQNLELYEYLDVFKDAPKELFMKPKPDAQKKEGDQK